jgi:histidinol phosphatase-like PHP family hydrolase
VDTETEIAERPLRHADVNAVVAGYLRDLALVQSAQPKMFGYKRASAAILRLETPLPELKCSSGELPRIPGIGPGSTRIIEEVLATGGSPTVERAIDASGKRAEIERRRSWRRHFLSRAEVLRILNDARFSGPTLADYGGDFQMHSEWSDGVPSVVEIRDACRERGYRYAAVTDHSHGLSIAGGMSMEAARAQRDAIRALNADTQDGFRLIHGVEANIGADGQLDLSDEEAAVFELVLAAPHSKLRRSEDQTARLVTAVSQPSVRILAHPRGRITGSRAGVIADWPAVFAAATSRGVAVEIDGDPSRQDLDYTLAAQALAAGCLFALDSDAHTTGQLVYAETAIAHARLAAIPRERIVNCWSLDRLMSWLTDPTRERLPPAMSQDRVSDGTQNNVRDETQDSKPG